MASATTSPSSSSENMGATVTLTPRARIATMLFPPSLSKLSIGRPRSLSSVSLASSRSGTPVPSLAPSTPHYADLSPRSSVDDEQPPIIQFAPRIVEHLDARDILGFSATTRHLRDLRTSLAFQRHLTSDGWDTGALVRRAEDAAGRTWMFLARSALDKADILEQYELLPKEGDKKKVDKKDKKAVERFLRVLVDVVTEHDNHNFEKLTSLANTLQMSLIQFVTAIQAHDWKTRYRKTFVIAAYTNAQPTYPEAECDLERLAATLDFDNPKPPVSFVATRANFLYTYGCLSSTTVPPTALSSIDYDPPHLSSSSGTSLPGLGKAIERYKLRTTANGFYRMEGGRVTSLHMALEPKGLASKSSLPFKEKDQLTLTVTCTDGDGNPPWDMEGSLDTKTGVGKLKSASGNIIYELWTTPWGITGQKIRGETKHLGYFVLHWA